MARKNDILSIYTKEVEQIKADGLFKMCIRDRYLHFGRFAAKMDDVWNYIPSRISALLMIASAWIFRMDYKRAWACLLYTSNAAGSDPL